VILSPTMSDTAFTLPLVVSTTIPLFLGILPLVIISVALLQPAIRSHLKPKHRLPTDPSFRSKSIINKHSTANSRSTEPRPSKSSLNLRPLFLSAQAMTSDRKKMVRREDFGISPRPREEHDARIRGLFRGSNEPRAGGQGALVSTDKVLGKLDDGECRWIKSVLAIIVVAGTTVISGVLYLSLSGSTSNKALDIALAISITCLPFTCVTYAVYDTTSLISNVSSTMPVLLGLAASVGISSLSAYVSMYIAIAVSGVALVVLTLLVIAKTKIWDKLRGRRGIQLPLDEKKVNRRAEAEEADRRQTSWLTENSKSCACSLGYDGLPHPDLDFTVWLHSEQRRDDRALLFLLV
jgi:hypothetical protein